MTARTGTVPTSAGVAVTEQSGVAYGTDTVPAGCFLLVRNTTATPHNLVIATNEQFDGLAVSTTGATTVGTREIPIGANTNMVVRIPQSYGDANDQVGLGVKEATYADIKYTVLGA